jgi:subtilisin family serine protease
MLVRPNISAISVLFGLLAAAAGCHLFSPTQTAPDLAAPVPGLEPQPQSGRASLPEQPLPSLRMGDDRIRTSPSSFIPVRYAAGRAFIPVEGVLVDSGYVRTQANASLARLSTAEKHEQMQKLLKGVVGQIGREVALSDVFVASDVGYFSAWVAVQEYSELKNVADLPVDVKIAPVLQAEQKPHNSIGLEPPSISSNASFAEFSGIERMGVSAFTGKVKAELGLEPTGQRVKVGVTDTGVTYGHPAFRSKISGKSRVIYMKDFTSEGAGYISPLAKITVQRQTENRTASSSKTIPVTVNAQYLEVDALEKLNSSDQSELPFSNITDEIFALPKELVELLEVPETQVRLGVVSELSFATKDEQVDVNGNGKTDDSFYFFHSPANGRRAEKVWIDFSGTGHFNASKPMRDFNVSGDTIDVLSERIGLSFTDMNVSPNKQSDVNYSLRKIALVGFDPGNHGSHVAGIIGAAKTLSNDSDSTLARGVAPDASLMVNRVCANNSGCNATRAIIDLAQNGARIINMSLGGLTSDNDGFGVQETIINRLTELYDVLFVISAGNSGPGRQTVGSPSTARHALSVGATATPNMILRQYNWLGRGAPTDTPENGNDDFVMYFSSRGPSAAGGFKPNISAPGTQLSVIQLNSSLGSRAGTDVYWGTSMAAPAAAGAAALLLDAALAYNEKNPDRPLPTDALTLRRVLMDSARPFRVSSFNPATGETRKGIYSWIDQGYGMVSLPEAWELLKKKAALALNTGVATDDVSAQNQNITPDYQVRVLRTMGNGKRYDGSQTFKTGTLLGEESSERKFGQGIWLNTSEADKLVEVHFSRKLPLKAMTRKNVGELLRQLNTSSESFELETIYYGSRTEWLKVGVPQSTHCDEESTPINNTLTLIGAGAVELPVTGAPGPALNPLRASSLFVCLKKSAFSELTPGDHAALIRAYRIVDGQRDVLAAFEVPVYMTVPHHSAAMQAKFSVQRQIKSFMVDRHYVRVPQGVSVLRVALEVPQNDANAQAQCSAAGLMVLKGNNTSSPGDLAGSGGVALNCTSAGAAVSNRRVAKFTEMNPNPGIWDIHVLGRFQFPISSYKLDIDYATFADIAPLNLNPETISGGAFDAVLKESTFDAQPESSKSDIRLASLLGRTKHEISSDSGKIVIPSAAGQLARTYAADAGTVTITTTSIVSGLDIDVYVDECEDAELKNCKQVAESGNPASEERAVFLPLGGKFYAVRIDPFDVPASSAQFSATEIINAHLPEPGRVKITTKEAAPGTFKIEYGFDTASSKLLQDELFRSGKYEILGECKLANASGLTLVKVPVYVLAK